MGLFNMPSLEWFKNKNKNKNKNNIFLHAGYSMI
jgi:hypothetical protein